MAATAVDDATAAYAELDVAAASALTALEAYETQVGSLPEGHQRTLMLIGVRVQITRMKAERAWARTMLALGKG